jgi:hypothetical protein
MADPLLEVRNLKVSFRTEDELSGGGRCPHLAESETLGTGEPACKAHHAVSRSTTRTGAPRRASEGRDLMALTMTRSALRRGHRHDLPGPGLSLNLVYRWGAIAEQIRAPEHITGQPPRPSTAATLGYRTRRARDDHPLLTACASGDDDGLRNSDS